MPLPTKPTKIKNENESINKNQGLGGELYFFRICFILACNHFYLSPNSFQTN